MLIIYVCIMNLRLYIIKRTKRTTKYFKFKCYLIRKSILNLQVVNLNLKTTSNTYLLLPQSSNQAWDFSGFKRNSGFISFARTIFLNRHFFPGGAYPP